MEFWGLMERHEMWTIVVFAFLAAGTGGTATAIANIPVTVDKLTCDDQAALLTFDGSLGGGAPGNSYKIFAKCIETKKN
jgi:hypothetical protein